MKARFVVGIAGVLGLGAAVLAQQTVQHGARADRLALPSLGPAGSAAAQLEVDINPESRVKVSAPIAPVRLAPGRWQPVPIRVQNLAGITAPLRVSGPPQIPATAGGTPPEWRLDERPLTGQPEESRTLWFRSARPGTTAATLEFDAGQGTQDLGFRAEADLLFDCRVPGTVAQQTTGRTVEAQPLLHAAQRVSQALDLLGEPLSPRALALLEAAKAEPSQAAERVQNALDPLCLSELTLHPDGRLEARPGAAPPMLQEQGWRTFLVKVWNLAGAHGRLQVGSPSAAGLPGAETHQVPERWMDVSVVESRPLKPTLSGLALEYRLVQVYSRDAGSRTANLTYTIEDNEGVPADPAPDSASIQPEAATASPSVKLAAQFTSEPSQVLRFRVRDEKGKPAFACFEVRDAQGRVYPAQAKRLAPDFFFHTQVYRGDGETLTLPAGEYTVRCSRGPESIPEVKQLRVGTQPVELSYQVKRWIDPVNRGWFSGDHHIHAAGCAHYTKPTEGVLPQDMARHIQGEDLKVGANLTWGPGFDYQKQFFTGKTDANSRYPYLLRYDVEVSGFGSHHSGHLCLLLLKEQIYPGGTSKTHWPTLGLNTLKWAKRQGAVCGPAHSANGLAPTAQRVAGEDGPEGLPNYAIPGYDGIGANEFIVDVTHQVPGPDGKPVPAIDFISTMDTDRKAEFNMWYHVLNCGFRTRASGETDFPCITGERVGLGRVYVKQDGKLTYEDWCEGIRSGRSYVSDGAHHLMDFRGTAAESPRKTVQVGVKGSEIRTTRPGEVTFKVIAAARSDKGGETPVELIVNGYPAGRQMLPRNGKEQPLTFTTSIERSSWVAVRMFPGAHTNPIWVRVGDAEVRASRRSAEWCLKGVEQCWLKKERTYAPAEKEEARQAYEHARHVYGRVLAECVTP